jgi:hypothetical protein
MCGSGAYRYRSVLDSTYVKYRERIFEGTMKGARGTRGKLAVFAFVCSTYCTQSHVSTFMYSKMPPQLANIFHKEQT